MVRGEPRTVFSECSQVGSPASSIPVGLPLRGWVPLHFSFIQLSPASQQAAAVLVPPPVFRILLVHRHLLRAFCLSPCTELTAPEERPGCPSVQFSRSVVSDSMWPHELQHARPPCPSSTPRACSNSRPLSQWCHPTISSSVVPFSSCPQSFPASGSFPVSWLSASGGQRIGVSASMSVLLMNIQGWVPFGWPGLSLLTLYLACAPTGSVPWIPCTFCSQNAEKSGFLWLGNGSSQFLLHFSIRTFEIVFILWPNYLFSTIYKDTMYKTYSIVTIWIQMHLSS